MSIRLLLYLATLLPVITHAQTPTPATPRTPTEARQQAIKPMRNTGATLETYMQALAEQKRRARRLVGRFKVSDWSGEQLFDLGRLANLAEQHEDTERALTAYLRDPAAEHAKAARQLLLYALAALQKWDAATVVADALLSAPEFDEEVIDSTRAVMNGLRPSQTARAIALGEKLYPKLLRHAAEKGGNPTQAVQLLESALELGQLYREAGKFTQAAELIRSFRVEFGRSPLAANQFAEKLVEAAIRRVELVESYAPPLEVTGRVGVLPTGSLAALKGKVVLLDFFGHFCAPCVANIPELNRLKKTYEAQGLVVLGVTTYFGYFGERQQLTVAEEHTALQKLLAERDVQFGLLVGPKSNFNAYGVVGLPAMALLDREGRVRYFKTGEAMGAATERLVRSLLAERTPRAHLQARDMTRDTVRESY